MASLKLNNIRTPNVGDVWLTGSVYIVAAGAIAANSTDTPVNTFAKNGFTVVKNAAAGRYDITFYKKFKRVKAISLDFEGPNAAAFPTTTGVSPRLRAPATAAARYSSAIAQLVREDTQADADAANPSVLHIAICVSSVQ